MLYICVSVHVQRVRACCDVDSGGAHVRDKFCDYRMLRRRNARGSTAAVADERDDDAVSRSPRVNRPRVYESSSVRVYTMRAHIETSPPKVQEVRFCTNGETQKPHYDIYILYIM